MKLLTQGDDYGFTKGVTYGILDAIDNGFLKCTGMFANMEIAPWAAQFVRERPNVCFGIDFNLVAGPCAADPKLIPHLVDENGRLISSKYRVADPRWKTPEGQDEVYPYEEVYIELKAQYDRFVELCGRKPGYLNGHSLVCGSINRAIKRLSEETGVIFGLGLMDHFYSTMNIKDPEFDIDNVSNTKQFNADNQVRKNPKGKLLKYKDEFLKHDYCMAIGHPGFVDADLFNMTSLSIERARDHEMFTSKEIMDWIKENNVQVIDYYDLVKDIEDGKFKV